MEKGINISLLALSLLAEKEYYGYEMTLKIKELTDGKIDIFEGSLYPALYRLEDEGYITSEKALVGKRMTRVYYKITAAGEAKLIEMLKQFEEYVENIKRILYR